MFSCLIFPGNEMFAIILDHYFSYCCFWQFLCGTRNCTIEHPVFLSIDLSKYRQSYSRKLSTLWWSMDTCGRGQPEHQTSRPAACLLPGKQSSSQECESWPSLVCVIIVTFHKFPAYRCFQLNDSYILFECSIRQLFKTHSTKMLSELTANPISSD